MLFRSYHLFNDDMVLELELPTSSTARYFICYADGLNGETSVTSSSLHLFAPEKGRLVVQSLYALERIVIYDSVGRVVVEKSCHDTFTDTFILPAGVYMVKAFTTIGHEVHKVVIH